MVLKTLPLAPLAIHPNSEFMKKTSSKRVPFAFTGALSKLDQELCASNEEVKMLNMSKIWYFSKSIKK